MTDQQINIAIAESLGWKLLANNRWTKPCGMWADLPNYTADLNAMHEAEKVLIEKCKESDYWFYLREILEFPDAESDWDHNYYVSVIHATAAQRAEAFMRALNLWK